MGSFSTCRALAHWQGLLLAVSLLSFWSLASALHFNVYSAAGNRGDVILRISNITLRDGTLIWFKGPRVDESCVIVFLTITSDTNVSGPAVGQVTIENDGSLLLKNVTKDNKGIYTIVNHDLDLEKEVGFKRLKVHEPVIFAYLLHSNTTGIASQNALALHCHTNAVSIQWFFKGKRLTLTERVKLSKDHRNLIINPVKKKDSGMYQCEGSNFISSVKSWPLELNVEFE